MNADGLFNDDKADATKASTICIAVANYALDHPFMVRVTQTNGRQLVPVWPGQMTRITLDSTKGDVAHLEVRGFPRGDAFRAMAREGGLLERGQSAEELSAQAANIASSRAGLDTDRRAATALRLIAGRLEGDTGLAQITAQLSAALGTADMTNAGVQASRYVTSVLAMLDDIRSSKAGTPENDSRALGRTLSVLPPLPLPTGADQVKQTVAALIGLPDKLRTAADGLVSASTLADQATKETTLRRSLTGLCQLSTYAARVAMEDILIPLPKETTDRAVLQYEFASGYMGASTGDRHINDTQRLFIRIIGVPPNTTVRVEVNDAGFVQYAPKVIGASPQDITGQVSKAVDLSSASARPDSTDRFDDLNIRSAVPSTQIISLGRLTGGNEFTIAVCVQNGASAASCTSTDANAPRLLGKHSLPVHSQGHLGIRMGVGMVATAADSPQVVAVDTSQTGSSGSSGYVRLKDVKYSFAVPLLIALYPCGRDTVGPPPPASFGLVSGTDLTVIGGTPKAYPIGAVLDLYGVGITAAWSLEQVTYDVATPGTYVTSTVKTDTRWRPGAIIAVTTDLNIFEVMFKRYFLDKGLPKIGGGS